MTASFEDISTILAEAGSELDLGGVIGFEDMDTWQIALDDEAETVITLERVSDGSLLVVSAEIGSPPAERLLETYDYALTFNGLWAETGGARLALDAPGGMLTLLREMAVSELSLQSFVTRLAAFATLVKAQQLVINQGISGEAGDAPSPDPAGAPETGALRV